MADYTELLKKHNFEQEKVSAKLLDPPQSSYPAPVRRYKLIIETFGTSVEEPYFWVLNHLREAQGFSDIIKLRDIFTATETSSMWGSVSQRLQFQQDRATQYITQIGRMIKENIFGPVHEAATIEERIILHKSADKGDRAAEATLKSLWIEFVERGINNPNSVYGLSREVGFATLPDFFFSRPLLKKEEVDKHVAGLDVNEKVKIILASKLRGYLGWREKNVKEMETRFKFLTKGIRENYNIIKLYLNWLRPYLMHIKRLSQDMDQLKSPDLITAFEQSMIDIEFLAKKKAGDKYYQCLDVHFNYRTRPSMEFKREGMRHEGPIHIGRVEITFRAYIWDEEQVKAYQEYRDAEDMELLKSINQKIAVSMEDLGDDLKRYLKAAGEEFPEDEKAEQERKKAEEKIGKPEKISLKTQLELLFSPFKHIINGMGELFGGIEVIGSEKKEKSIPKNIQDKLKQEKSDAEKKIKKSMFVAYLVFKKTHGMLAP